MRVVDPNFWEGYYTVTCLVQGVTDIFGKLRCKAWWWGGDQQGVQNGTGWYNWYRVVQVATGGTALTGWYRVVQGTGRYRRAVQAIFPLLRKHALLLQGV